MKNLNFKITELLSSDVANKHKIKNIPDNLLYYDNLLNLIYHCLQPIRDHIQKPMIIKSGYRNSELNKLVGGKSNSQHLIGQAADFIIKDMSVRDIINIIQKTDIVFDQLINEYDKWVHISYSSSNRKQILNIK